MAQTQYVCTLCNIDFSVLPPAEARCPRCLRLTGVVGTDEADKSSGPSLRVTLRRLRLAGAALGVAAVLGVGAYVAFTLLAGAGPYRDLAEECRGNDLPVPWAGFEAWGRECSATSFAELADMAGQAGFSPALSGERPTEILTGKKLAERGGGRVTSIEAAGFLLGCALASDLEVTPCRKKAPGLATPFSSRKYGLCLTEEGAVTAATAPFGEPGELEEWESMEPAGFLAHFLAAAGEAAADPREAYRLFGAALGFRDEPALYFSRGLAKVRNGVVEFGVDDMRKAVAGQADPDALVAVGEALMEQGNAGEALQEFSRAYTLERGNLAARFGIARARLASGAADKALVILDELVQEEADLPGLQTALAHAYLHLARYEETVDESTRLLEEGLKKAPGELRLYLALYMLYQWHDRAALAGEVRTRAYDQFGEEDPEGIVKVFSELHERVERTRTERKRASEE